MVPSNTLKRPVCGDTKSNGSKSWIPLRTKYGRNAIGSRRWRTFWCFGRGERARPTPFQGRKSQKAAKKRGFRWTQMHKQ
jgi:hypothetical protein